ncbi:MAG: M81 family metallopeptidase [Thermomicrobiales bacterium]
MRVAIAEFKQETNTFVPRSTTLEDFRLWHLWYGEEVIDGLQGTNAEIDGFLRVLNGAGVEPVPLLATFAMSGGRVTDDAYQQLLGELLVAIEQAGPLDGVLLALHGAMATESYDSADGRTLAAVRQLVGPDVPVVASYDLHANLTAEMASNATALVGFKTSPHIDQRDTGERAARVMTRILVEGARPAMAFVKVPMIAPASIHVHHLPGPFKRLQDATKTLEGGAVLSANVATVQPWLDIDEMGFATVVVTDNDPELAAELACSLANQAWEERHAFMEIDLTGPDEAIRLALAEPEGPVVLSDCADGTGAGSPGDATAVIAALLQANPDRPAYVFVRDEDAAAAAIAAGVGNEVTLDVGGRVDNVFNAPVRINGTVAFAGPASFRFGGEGYTGVEQEMGPSAVVRVGNVYILIVSTSVMTVDPELYRAVGLEPAEAQIVVVKSHIQFRAGYAGLAKKIILLDSPGMSRDHLESLPWRRVPRPIFPLDRETEFTCQPAVFGGGRSV